MPKLDFNEVVHSLNGFEEIAIDKHFSADILDLLDKPIRASRALLMVLARRDGKNDAEAFAHAMNLTLTEVEEAFEETADEVSPDEPVTPAGKELSDPVPEPADSPASVSPPESSHLSTPL